MTRSPSEFSFYLPFHAEQEVAHPVRTVSAPGPGSRESTEQARREVLAETLLQAWVASPNETEARAGLTSALPTGTVFDRVAVDGRVAAAFVAMPADFLGAMDEAQCEQIVRDQVTLLRQVKGLRSFMIFVRPIDGGEEDYKPLPDYLPVPAAELDKPEEPDSENGLRAGGLPTYNPGRPAGALSGKTVFLSPGHGWYYSSTLGRWATQRGNSYGIIEDHSNGEAVLLHLARYLHNAGANVWPCRERDFNTHMVIVDNSDGSPGFTVTDTWPTSTGAGTWYGADYQYHAVSASETAVATYAPDIPESGEYSVYVWTPSASNRSTDARVRVRHAGGTTEHILNMQRDGNTWRFLGLYRFEAGRNVASGSVEISNQGSDPSKVVIADAVRFGGGMGDYADGGSVSGKPRWEESGSYYPNFMGQPGTPIGTVSGMPRYAAWESESWEDSIYVSWHTNATGSPSVTGHGTDVYVYGPNGPPSPFGQFSGVAGSDSLAIRIRDEIVNDLRISWNDPAWPGDLFSAWFGELNPSNNNEMPSCLIEVAYHDSEVDAESILDPRFRDLVSRAVYQAIVRWWRYDADGPSTTPTATDTLLPEPPTHLAVRNLGNGTVRVSWRPPPFNTGNDLLGDAATGYIVQISTDGFGFDDGTSTSSTFLDFTGLPAGENRYFRVIATNEGGQSFPSEIGGTRVTNGGTAPVLVCTGFDRMDRGMLLIEDDPYDADPMLRERPQRMNHYGYVRTFGDAIDAADLAFDSCTNEAVRDQDVSLLDYPAVLWHSGEESEDDHTFDSAEQNAVWDYVVAAGKLFVSGSEIGWDLDDQNNQNGRVFYNQLLRADFVSDDAGTYAAAAVGGSIFDGIAPFTFDNGATIYDVDSPDVIAPLNGGTAALTYTGGTGGTAGIVYDGSYKLVNFGFPFESITDRFRRIEVLYAVLDFFGLDPAPPPPPPPGDVILEARDASGAVTLPPTYNEVGSWANSTIKSSAAGLTGTGSRFMTYEVPNSGTDNATFAPNVVTAGKYEVFTTWANGANCYDARYTVRHYHGDTVLLVDQIPTGAPEAPNFDAWISLGQYWFSAGQSQATGSVNVSEATVTGRPSETWNFRVYADGLKLSFVDWWPNGDDDDDGDVDLDDYASLADCLTGPGGGYASPACQVFDFDLDGDVDLPDASEFQAVFGTAR